MEISNLGVGVLRTYPIGTAMYAFRVVCDAEEGTVSDLPPIALMKYPYLPATTESCSGAER